MTDAGTPAHMAVTIPATALRTATAPFRLWLLRSNLRSVSGTFYAPRLTASPTGIGIRKSTATFRHHPARYNKYHSTLDVRSYLRTCAWAHCRHHRKSADGADIFRGLRPCRCHPHRQTSSVPLSGTGPSIRLHLYHHRKSATGADVFRGLRLLQTSSPLSDLLPLQHGGPSSPVAVFTWLQRVIATASQRHTASTPASHIRTSTAIFTGGLTQYASLHGCAITGCAQSQPASRTGTSTA